MQQDGVLINIINKNLKLKNQTVDLFCTGEIGCFRIVLSDQVAMPPESEVIVREKVLEQ